MAKHIIVIIFSIILVGCFYQSDPISGAKSTSGSDQTGTVSITIIWPWQQAAIYPKGYLCWTEPVINGRGTIWTSLQDGNSGNAPATSPRWWSVK